MLRNYVKIAWRNIARNGIYSVVNMIGLSIGIAFTLLIGVYVWGETQVNAQLRNKDRQYIIQSKWKESDQGMDFTTFSPLAGALKEHYPHLVANYFHFDGITSTVSKGDKSFREEMLLGDSTMLDMYGFELLHGNPRTALQGAFSLVLTENKARKYFGKTDVLGQTLTIENFGGEKHDFQITGVLKTIPPNSVTNLTGNPGSELFIPAENHTYFGRNMDNWNNFYIVGYVELQPGIQPSALNKPMLDLVKQNTSPQLAESVVPYLTPLKDYYINANNGTVRKMLLALSAIALFILLMAVVNFINMSVSRAASRMKEIGVRKVLGGLKRQLILQFLMESLIIVSCATLFAFFICLAIRPVYNDVLGKAFPSFSSLPVYFLAFPLVLILFTGLLSGLYPAFVLSSLRTVESLKGKLVATRDNVLLRKSLVIFQFGIATVVLIFAIIISNQVNLFFSKNLGYDKDFIISAQVPRNWTPEGVQRMEDVRANFAGMSQIKSATLSYEVPNGNNAGNIYTFREGTDSTAAMSSQSIFADEHYAATYGIPMAAGVFFQEQGAASANDRVVINATQAKAFGWKNPQDALGKRIKIMGRDGLYTVAGVTKDFHFSSMQRAIEPITMMHVNTTTVFRFLSFKIKPSDITQSVEAIGRKWAELLPGTPFDYKFMDQTLSRMYDSEIRLKKACFIATVVSIAIVLLGVLGLISMSIQKRTKEIGVRKVLGSSVANIVGLFMKEFVIIIGVATLIACPLAYVLTEQWLNDYVYRIDITAMPFLLTVGVLSVVTMVLIFAQTIRTAMANPVKSLRSE